MKITSIIWTTLHISIYLIYWHNYRSGIEPTFLSVFEMMSGFVTPKSIGITDEMIVRQLLNKSKLLFKLNKVINNRTLYFVAILIIIPYLLLTPLKNTLSFGLPNGILFGLIARYTLGLSLWQMTYFYIVCYYLKLKLNSLNKRLTKPMNNQNILQTINSFNRLYLEISDYNKTYFSKYLFAVWLLMGSVIMFDTCAIIFIDFAFIVKFTIIYTLIMICLIFVMIILTAASVNSLANKSHHLFNQQFIYHSNNQNCKQLAPKFKVYIF